MVKEIREKPVMVRRRRIALGSALVLLVTALVSSHAVAHTRRSLARGGRPPWLVEINRYRRAAGLVPASDNIAWDAGIRRHLIYLAKTRASFETGDYASAHTENPASPYYTKAGALEGSSSDLYPSGSETPLGAVDGWLAAPFHAVGMLRPALREVAFAIGGLGIGGAGLDVIRGLNGAANPHQKPVLFPGRGITTNLTTFTGEEPDPTQSCRGRHDGLPLIILLPYAVPRDIKAVLKMPHKTEEHTASGSLCLVDQYTYRTTDPVYGPTGREILQGDHAVFLIPRTPLTSGTYQAGATVGGKHVVWSFKVKSSPTSGSG